MEIIFESEDMFGDCQFILTDEEIVKLRNRLSVYVTDNLGSVVSAEAAGIAINLWRKLIPGDYSKNIYQSEKLTYCQNTLNIIKKFLSE